LQVPFLVRIRPNGVFSQINGQQKHIQAFVTVYLGRGALYLLRLLKSAAPKAGPPGLPIVRWYTEPQTRSVEK
jgi:hypothetical protein